jgi:signal transduction histidine kinase
MFFRTLQMFWRNPLKRSANNELNVTKPNIWQTLAMRLAIRQSIFLSGLTLLAMLTLYWALNSFVLAQISSDLSYNLGQLTRIQQTQGQASLIENLQQLKAENQTRGHSHRYYLLLSAQGERLAGGLQSWPEEVVLDSQVANVLLEKENLPLQRMDIDEGFWPAVATEFTDGSKLLITQSIDSTEQLKDFTLMVMLLLFGGVTFISLLLGWLLGNKILQRIDPINQTARAIESGNLSHRVRLPSLNHLPDEFDELASHLNRMLDTIEQLMRDMRQVSQNIAHDLRKPLTRIQTRVENLQSQPSVSSDALSDVLQEMDSLGKTFNALLQLGRLESGTQSGVLHPVNLSKLCENLSDLYQDMGSEQGLIWVNNLSENLWVQGDRQLLAQAIINLLENALNYTHSGERIEFRLQLTPKNRVEIRIDNSGVDIKQEQLLEIQKPFVRLDSARSDQGNGLGLPMVKAICDVHHSTLKLSIKANLFSAVFVLNRSERS